MILVTACRFFLTFLPFMNMTRAEYASLPVLRSTHFELQGFTTAISTKEHQYRFGRWATKTIRPRRQFKRSSVTGHTLPKEELIALLKDDGNLDKHDFPLASISNEELSKILELNQEIDDIYIATPLQAGLIFHGLFDGADSGYILQTYCDLVGDIDLEAMKKAWQLVVDRHDILRTCFAGLDSENIHQLVKQQCPLHFNEEDWRDVQKDILSEKLELYRKADKAKGFDFEQAPLLRFSLIRIEDARYHFVYAGHHALVDGWCTPILFKEVFAFYHQLVANQKPSLPPVLQFKEYIRWLLKKDPTASRLFWKEYLQGFLNLHCWAWPIHQVMSIFLNAVMFIFNFLNTFQNY